MSRAVRERQHPAGDRNRGPAAASPAGSIGGVGVLGGSEHLIERLGAGPELGRIGLADDDRSGCLEPFHVELVLLGHEVAVDRRSERGADAAGQGEVLARDGQAVERPRRFASGEGGIRCPCAFERGLGKQGDDGVDRGVHRLDSGEEPGHELFGAQLALDEPAHQIAGRGEDDFGVRGEGVGHGVDGLVWVWGAATFNRCKWCALLLAAQCLMRSMAGAGPYHTVGGAFSDETRSAPAPAPTGLRTALPYSRRTSARLAICRSSVSASRPSWE